MNVTDLQKKAAQVRVDALKAIHKAGAGHTGSAMSVVEILVSLYYGDIGGRVVAQVDPAKPGWEDQDYVVLAKGQAAVTQYSVLADLGFIDKSELEHYRAKGSILTARPNVKVPGICASVLSHGVGLSIATGLAMSLKMERKKNRVFCVMGDGELQEGQVWEAAATAAHYKLNNLVAFIDNDGFQMDGPTRAVLDPGYIQDKFESFGWNVIKVTDGHDFDQILEAVNRGYTTVRRPVCIWCQTVAGKGVPFAEGKRWYLDSALGEAEMNEVIPKLEQLYD